MAISEMKDNLGKPGPESYTILDFTGARDDGMAMASHRPYAPRSRQITTPVPHHSVLQAGCSSCSPTNSVKALKAKAKPEKHTKC